MTPEEAAAEERAAAEVGASSLPVSGAAGVPTPGLGEEESQKKLREGIQKTRKTRKQEIIEIRIAQNAPLKAKMEEFKGFIDALPAFRFVGDAGVPNTKPKNSAFLFRFAQNDC